MACRTKAPFRTLPLSALTEREYKIKQFLKEEINNFSQSRFYIVFSYCNSVPTQKHLRAPKKWHAETGRLSKSRVG